MILQQLARDADRIVGSLPPPMYDNKPVKWIIELDDAGQYLGCIPTSSGAKKDKGANRLVPYITRTVNIQPILLVDTPVYTLGLEFDDKRASKKYAAYRDLLALCAVTTQHKAVKAVITFLDRRQAEPAAMVLPLDIEKSDLVTFRVNGAFPTDEAAIRDFWVQQCIADVETGQQTETECLVCGQRKLIEESLPVPIKRIPGGQSSGVAPVSVNADAFESYGLARGKTSGVCRECGERFGKALNHLLAAEDSHLAIGPLVYVFWTREGAGFSLVNLLNRPDQEEVLKLLTAYRSGIAYTAIDDQAFYATALSASGGRAVVRDWLHTTVGNAARNLARWFELLTQVDGHGGPGRPLGIYTLSAGLYRDANKEMVAHVPHTLIASALHGDALPVWLLSQAVNRCRAEGDVTYPRAALMKAVLVSQNPEKEHIMAQLSLEERQPGYLCGRLLAVLEEIQREAIPGINATLVDRFFGSASTAPAGVFGKLLSGAQPHLAKLRKTRPSAYLALQQRLEEVAARLDTFPKTLTLQDQALFSLGYYHQRAADRAAALERKVARAIQHQTDIEEEKTHA